MTDEGQGDCATTLPVVISSAWHNCQREAEQLGAAAVIPELTDLDTMLAVIRRYAAESGADVSRSPGISRYSL